MKFRLHHETSGPVENWMLFSDERAGGINTWFFTDEASARMHALLHGEITSESYQNYNTKFGWIRTPP